MAKTAMWTDEEMCQNLFRFVRKPVSTFIRQLGKRAWTWRTLEADLKAEYLRSDESPMERYCSLAQDRVESARHFLWRLNAAAERANLEVRGGDGLERHVTRFARALRDPVLKSKMSSVVVRSLGDLDKMLALHEVRVGKDRKDAPAKERERGISRDRDRDYDRDRHDRERDRSVSRARSASTYWAYQEDYGGNDYARSVSDFAGRSDAPTERTVRFEEDEDFFEALSEEGSHAYKATGSTTSAPGRFAGGGARWQPSGQAASPRYRSSNVNRPVAAPHPGPASLAGTSRPGVVHPTTSSTTPGVGAATTAESMDTGRRSVPSLVRPSRCVVIARVRTPRSRAGKGVPRVATSTPSPKTAPSYAPSKNSSRGTRRRPAPAGIRLCLPVCFSSSTSL
jgi:hypothetical protein